MQTTQLPGMKMMERKDPMWTAVDISTTADGAMNFCSRFRW